jgi:hypothetical protein
MHVEIGCQVMYILKEKRMLRMKGAEYFPHRISDVVQHFFILPGPEDLNLTAGKLHEIIKDTQAAYKTRQHPLSQPAPEESSQSDLIWPVSLGSIEATYISQTCKLTDQYHA